MAENQGDKEDKFDPFDPSGQTLGYISLEQARVLAMRHAAENPDFYGPAYSGINLVREVTSQEEGEDYYDIKLSFRPAGRYRGEPGVEQFIIDKTGAIEIRQILDEPTGMGRTAGRRPRLLLPTAVGLVIVVVVVVAVFASGIIDSGQDDEGPASAASTAAPEPTQRSESPGATTNLSPSRQVATGPTPVSADQTADKPTPAPVSPQTVSRDSVRQTLLREVASVAPGLAQDSVQELVSSVLSQPEALGKTNFTLAEANRLVALAREKARGIGDGTVSLGELKPILLEEIRSAAPRLSQNIVDELVSGALAEAQATGRTSFTDSEVKEYLSLVLGNLPADNPEAPVAVALAPLLRVAVSGVDDPSILPWNRNAEGLIQLRPMFEYLLELDVNGEIVPMLAEQWEVDPGGRRWTFALRKKVPFHYGWGEFTASDVAHSFNMLIQDLSRAGSAAQWREAVRNVEVIDANTVSFVLNRPVPDFMQWVSSQGDLMMLSSDQWDAEGPNGMERRPAGTGPYRFIERTGRDMRFKRVENHWRQTPEFEELLMFVVPDAATRTAGLKAGQVDIAVIPRTFEEEIRGAGMQITVGRLPAYGITFVMGGQYYATPDRLDRNVPWIDPRVRLAMNLAIDSQAINEFLFGGQGELMPVAGFHPTLPGWNPNWLPGNPNWNRYPYDMERARALMAEAGYLNGFELEIIVARETPEMVRIAQALTEMFDDIGIKSFFIEMSFAELRRMALDQDLHGVLWGVRAGYRQTEEAIQVLNYSGPGGIVHSYEDPQIDKMYEQLLQEADPQIREKLLRTIGDIKFDNYAEIPLFWVRTTVGINPKVVGDYGFPGTVPGQLSHLEYVEAAR